MDACAEGRLYLRNTPGKGDEGGAARHSGDGETLAGKPPGDLRHVSATETKTRPVLLRGEPLMIARRTGILLGCQKLGKVRLLRRCQVEAQRERLKLCALRREAHVRRKLYPSRDVALHRHPATGV